LNETLLSIFHGDYFAWLGGKFFRGGTMNTTQLNRGVKLSDEVVVAALTQKVDGLLVELEEKEREFGEL